MVYLIYIICVCVYVFVLTFYLTFMYARNSLGEWCVICLYITLQFDMKLYYIMRNPHRGLVHWLKSILPTCGNQIDKSLILLSIISSLLKSELFYVMRNLLRGLVHWLKSILLICGNQSDIFNILLSIIYFLSKSNIQLSRLSYILSSELCFVMRNLHGGLVHWLKSILPTCGNQIDMLFIIYKLVLLLFISYSCIISHISVTGRSFNAACLGQYTHVRLECMDYEIILHYMIHNSYE